MFSSEYSDKWFKKANKYRKTTIIDRGRLLISSRILTMNSLLDSNSGKEENEIKFVNFFSLPIKTTNFLDVTII